MYIYISYITILSLFLSLFLYICVCMYVCMYGNTHITPHLNTYIHTIQYICVQHSQAEAQQLVQTFTNAKEIVFPLPLVLAGCNGVVRETYIHTYMYICLVRKTYIHTYMYAHIAIGACRLQWRGS